jgi:nitrous oxidase accessory protein NosD
MESEELLKRKARHSLMVYALLFGVLLAVLFVKCDFQHAKGDWVSTEPIYIRVDGTIEPSNVPISTVDLITYTLTDNIIGNNLPNLVMITVQRNNVILDGTGHLLQCTSRQTDATVIGISASNVAENISIKNFEIKGFSIGIEISIIKSRISSNILSDNVLGIGVSGSDNEISDNQIVGNIEGLASGRSDHNLICNNTIANKVKGIRLGANAIYNVIMNNRIENNGWGYDGGCGVELYPPAGAGSPPANYNYFYHNDFVNNRQQIYDWPMYSANMNYWDNEFASGGNYWSDYTGYDLYSGVFQNETCRDGIGDTPYTIDESNQDRFPLLKPWQEHLNPPVARFEYAPKIGYALQEIAFNSFYQPQITFQTKSHSTAK